MRTSQAALLAPLLGVWAIGAAAQVTRADYDRATAVRTKFQNLAVNIPGPATWAGPARFVYRKSVTGGHEWTLVDAATAAKTPPFDHARLAAGLSAAAGAKYTALTLPFTAFEFVDNGAALITSFNQANWRCGLSTYTCAKAAPSAESQRRNPPPEWDGDPFTSPEEPESPQQGRGRETADTPETPAARSSPDGKWEAVIQNFNVFLRAKESAAATATATAIGTDGSEGNFYTLRSIAWSPDSRYLVAYRVRPGYKREVHYVESSPADQLQPKHSTREYAKPGDALDIPQPVLFDIAAKRQHSIANTLTST